MKAKSKRIMGLFLALVMLIGCLPFNIIETYAAEGNVEINETNFPDRTFREYVSKNFNTDKTGGFVLSQEELNAVTSIDVSVDSGAKGLIESIKGIEHFPNLETLNCKNNSITGDLDLSKNTSLKELDCRENEITSLSNIPKSIETIICSENKLTKLDLSECDGLKKLNCDKNKIEVLNLPDNGSLSYLVCSQNKLAELDLKGHLLLQTLDCSYNNLTKLDLSRHSKFGRGLYFQENQITKVLANKKIVFPDSRFTYQIYNIEVPRGTSEIKFPDGFEPARMRSQVTSGITFKEDAIEWDEQTKEIKFNYELTDIDTCETEVTVKFIEVRNEKLEEATALVETAEKDKTEEEYNSAKAAVDALAKGSGKTGLVPRLAEVEKYLKADDALKVLEGKAAKDLKDADIKAAEELIKAVKNDWQDPLNERVNKLRTKMTTFDPENVVSIAIQTQPTNLNYTDGDKLDLTGLVVTLTDDKNLTKDVALAEFEANGITTNPANGAELTLNDNNNPVIISKGSLQDETNALTVNVKKYTLTLEPQDKITVENAASDNKYEKDSTITFTVAAEANKKAKVEKIVSEQSETLTAVQDGKYSFKITADTTIKVTYEDEPVVPAVNTQPLQEKIAEAKKVLEKDSTSDPAKALSTKVTEAEALINTATEQSQVDEKVTELETAIKAVNDLQTAKDKAKEEIKDLNLT
ncbi:leucine-rich repeat domain-containing protein, partial [Peptoniphilus sp.]|uniref:leucine-rich repeat domain-containing protein n=1 Tax=Peptoniphilus sp. TaxID=1971214 RepID=UPI00399285F1